MKKAIMIGVGVVVGIIVLAVAILVILSLTSKKMTCKSPEASITIMYNDDTITGFTSNGIGGFGIAELKAGAERMGVNAYLDEFADYFAELTDGGVCER